jgi:hypothetical protein
MPDFEHRPSVLLAVDKETISELGSAFRRRVRIKGGIEVCHFASRAVGDFVERTVVE